MYNFYSRSPLFLIMIYAEKLNIYPYFESHCSVIESIGMRKVLKVIERQLKVTRNFLKYYTDAS